MHIAFYKGTRLGIAGIYNRGVRLVTHGIYSHCELVFSDDMSASSSYMDHGVRFKRIKYDPAQWDFIKLPDHLETPAYYWFIKHEGQGYDLRGNLQFLSWMVTEDKKKWFCSESIAAALGMKDPWRYHPSLLYSALSLLSISAHRNK